MANGNVKGYELIVIWDTGEKEVYEYDTEEEAEVACDEYKAVFGNQISWTGTRRSRIERKERITKEEANARWMCCPLCDKKKCERESDDCDVKKYLKDKSEKEEEE